MGEGGYGEVWKVRHSITGEVMALKILDADEGSLQEAKLLRELNHPSLLRVYDVDLCEGKLLISMELGEYSLRDKLGPVGEARPLPLGEAEKLFLRLAEGLEYLHSKGVVHGDLKPSNVVYVGGEPKLTDFGMAKIVDPEVTRSIVSSGPGNAAYYPPEAFTSSDMDVLEKAEVYALGRIMVEAYTGTLYDLGGVPKERRGLLEAMLSLDYRERPSIREVSERLGGGRLRSVGERRGEEVAVPTSNARTRPLGISALAIISGLSGIFEFIFLIYMLTSVYTFETFESMYGTADLTYIPTLLYAIVALYMGMGLFNLILSWGFWTGQGWAWKLGIILSIAGIIIGMIGLPQGGFALVIISIVILGYLFRPHVKEYFGKV